MPRSRKRLYPMRRRRIVWVTPLLAVAMVISFITILLLGSEHQAGLFARFGLHSASQMDLIQALIRPELIGSLFFHVDGWHLAANVGFLLVFGIPIEREWGGGWIALLLLIAGVVSNLAASFSLAPAAAPIVGASGAVSGVIGAYVVEYPRSRIGVLVPLGLFVQYFRVSAIAVISAWFVIQILYTWLGNELGGVAWWAHVAGFVAGMGVAIVASAVRRR